MACKVADSKLSSEFNIGTTHMALVNSNLSQKDTRQMIDKLKAVDGVNQAIGLDSVLGSDVPEDMIPDSVKSILQNGNYKLLLINTEYKVASTEIKKQIDDISSIIKSYDSGAMLIGEASCTEDMIKITDTDFKVVDIISILSIFIIIALVLKSVSLPVILVAAIEFAIFINLGIPYYSGTALPFITPICISTIQLGSTVDYAILMTNRYIRERRFGLEKHEAARISLSTSAPPVMVSALGFFAATFGVAMYSKVDMISSMCLLIGRGALISMLCVIFILPALFILFDKVIMKTTWLYKNTKKQINLFVPAEEEK
jgi:predicted RND superfamily exporter protein